MRFQADIAGEKHELQFKREGERVLAQIDGRQVEMEVRETEEGGYLLIVDGRVYDARVRQDAAQPHKMEVHVGSRAYSVSLTDPKRLRSADASATDGEGTAQIVAQMPGKVVRVLISVGAQVEVGDGVVVVEAMKMQNELKSPKAGVVTTLNARAGETVNAGEVLAVIE